MGPIAQSGAAARVFLAQRHAAEGELTYDASAYDMLHALRVDWPCLSVAGEAHAYWGALTCLLRSLTVSDTLAVLRDLLGAARRRFPHTAYVAAGTQADRAEANKLVLLKLSALRKTKYDDDSDASRSDDADALAAAFDAKDDDDAADDDDIDPDVAWKASLLATISF